MAISKYDNISFHVSEFFDPSQSENFISIFWNIMERNRFDLEIDLFHRLHSINDCAPFELLTIDLLLSRMYTFARISVCIYFYHYRTMNFKEKNDRRKERKRKYIGS